MAIAFDAASNQATTTGNISFTHTPVGTPKGALLLITQLNAIDDISAATYGGVAMSEVNLSPLLQTSGSGGKGTLYGYFLGSGIPTGAQTVAATRVSPGTQNARPVCITVTAANDTAVDITGTADTTGTNPTKVIAVTQDTFVAAAVYTDNSNPANIAPGANYTEILENDYGPDVASWTRKTANATAGNVTVDWVDAGSFGYAILAVALYEIGVGYPKVVTF